MMKRLITAALWSFAGLYAGAFLAAVTGVDYPLGPGLAAIFAAAVVGGPASLSSPRSPIVEPKQEVAAESVPVGIATQPDQFLA